MGECVKRSDCISREAAISRIRDEGVLGGDYDAYEREEDVVDMLNSIPAADVVEVVRCKDCIHRDPEDRKCDCGGQERQGCPLPVRGSYFCAHGKRKDGGQDDV